MRAWRMVGGCRLKNVSEICSHGTGEALVTFMREYHRLISSKNMPVCVCVLHGHIRLWHPLMPVWITSMCPKTIWPALPRLSLMQWRTPHWSQLIVLCWALCHSWMIQNILCVILWVVNSVLKSKSSKLNVFLLELKQQEQIVTEK